MPPLNADLLGPKVMWYDKGPFWQGVEERKKLHGAVYERVFYLPHSCAFHEGKPSRTTSHGSVGAPTVKDCHARTAQQTK